ncbi:HU domain-containing protein [Nonlabens ponticola]|uniref:SPOR domain-containing protein n=1 Tax=Nonlabens ponticola TaxID=2496866 RepID=A0A3S9MVI5_9FLAO|nr:SPOR domain-containing protein [Nonlabens ponticola]AZQ43236.1 SPOR domain-containing protein [Nonlabens ponticola]
MQVGTYISELLYRHECVVIPGYGAFLSRRVPAQHFASTHTLYPPKKGLSFNAQIQQNDGLLVNYISTVQQIPYDEALQQVRNYVRFLDHEIDEHGEVTIHKVGRFTRGAEDTLQFTPMYLVNYLPEAFGLATHEAYAVDRTPVTTPVEEVVIEEKPVVQLTTAKSNTANWVRAAAAVAILVAGSYLAHNTVKTQAVNDAMVIEQMADEQFKTKMQEATFLISTPLPSITMEVAPEIKNYHVVAGAFRSAANADKKVAQLQKAGYDARVIGVNEYGLHNVALGSYADRDDAINALYLNRKQGYPSAWLFTGTLEK